LSCYVLFKGMLDGLVLQTKHAHAIYVRQITSGQSPILKAKRSIIYKSYLSNAKKTISAQSEDCFKIRR